MDELSYWLNTPPPPPAGRKGGHITAVAPPLRFAAAGRSSAIRSYRAEHRRQSSVGTALASIISLPNSNRSARHFKEPTPAFPVGDWMASLSDLASVRLPNISQPVLVAGSVAALLAVTTTGMLVLDTDTNQRTSTQAAGRMGESAASRSEALELERLSHEEAEALKQATEKAAPESTTTTVAPTTEAPTTTTVAPTTTTTTTVAPKPKAIAKPKDTGPVGDDIWRKLANCESGGRNDGGAPYYGYFQFLPSTWKSVGGTALPNNHGYEAQKAKATELQKRSGWGQWPACSQKLGLR